MAYEDYIPKKAIMGSPAYSVREINVGGNTIKRRYLDPDTEIVELYEFDSDYNFAANKYIASNFTQIIDSAQEYGVGTYATGNEVKINALGLKYKWAGKEDLIVDAGNFDEKHPAAIDAFLKRTNTDWIVQGTIKELIPFDRSTETFIESSQGGMRIQVQPMMLLNYFDYFVSSVREDAWMLSIFGVSAKVASIQFLDPNDNEMDAFQVYMDTKDRLSLLIPFSMMPSKIIIDLHPYKDYYELFGSYGKAQCASVTLSYVAEIGRSIPEQHTSYRTASFQDIYVDGVPTSEVLKTYDVFSGTLVVDKENLQKTQYILSKSVGGDYVFHMGGGREKYDQCVYFGKIEYNSAMAAQENYEININGQSNAYAADNYLIPPDSTDGYPS